MVICDKKIYVDVEVVENDIPLLIGRPTMTKLGIILNTMSHSVTVDDHVYPLSFSKSGHYAISVSPWTDESCHVVFHIGDIAKYSKKEKRNKAKKLHRQFAHVSKEKLIDLLQDSGCDDKEFLYLIEKVDATCPFCLKYRHQQHKPVVGLPKAKQFNEVVGMDLKEVEKGKVYILHMKCLSSRYTGASIIRSKKKDIVVRDVIHIWLIVCSRRGLYRVKSQIFYFHFFFIDICYSDHKNEEIFQKYRFQKISKPFYSISSTVA